MKTQVIYWVVTALLGVSYLGMGAANWFQPGTMNEEIAKSGYPSNFFKLLGALQVLAGLVVLLPRLPRLKEWAYSGIAVNLIAAAHHHAMGRDGPARIGIPLIILLIAAVSWGLRPSNRRLPGSWM